MNSILPGRVVFLSCKIATSSLPSILVLNILYWNSKLAAEGVTCFHFPLHQDRHLGTDLGPYNWLYSDITQHSTRMIALLKP